MSNRQSQGLPASVALHRYWMYANRMRTYFERVIEKNPPRSCKNDEERISEAFLFMSGEPGTFMSHWYGALYVVIEGWKQLKLNDPTIDRLLQSPNVRLLKKYRDGTFHYQRKYFDDRFANFMRSRDSVPWVHDLTSAFGSYFLRMYKGDGPQV